MNGLGDTLSTMIATPKSDPAWFVFPKHIVYIGFAQNDPAIGRLADVIGAAPA